VGDLLSGAQFALCPLFGHDRLKHCLSLPDLIGRHLLVEYCGRDELAHTLARSQKRSLTANKGLNDEGITPPRQEKFCQEIVAGNTQSEAYREGL
jgi:hypothetical protein